jgi:hypothetical protein
MPQVSPLWQRLVAPLQQGCPLPPHAPQVPGVPLA